MYVMLQYMKENELWPVNAMNTLLQITDWIIYLHMYLGTCFGLFSEKNVHLNNVIILVTLLSILGMSMIV